ncbi:MAG: hemolysin family protein [Candidatus Palauibacterales bacterium]|nr:hemolysin family protein [Candidatus Palauibacterales bacterium]MDP2482545.1 hemolysin family protein [Candidatus Palauibacterales bacterium]
MGTGRALASRLERVPLPDDSRLMGSLFAARIALLLGLVAANGFFVAAEFALVASRHRAEEQPGEDPLRADPGIRRARRSLGRPISGAQLGIALSTLGVGWFGVTWLAPGIQTALDSTGLPSGVGLTVGVVVALAVVGGLHLILGELVPRALGLSRAHRIAGIVARPLNLFTAVMSPFLWVLNALAEPVVSRSGDLTGGYGQVHGPAEIEALLRHSRAEGVVEEDEEEMIHGVFELTRTVAREVMTPRPDIVAFPESASLDEVLDKAEESGFSRFPVYRESIDDVTGVVLIKDLLRWLRASPEEEFALTAVMREPFFIPDTKPVDDLLAEFRSQKLHLAVIVDEFGGTDGVVTLEDLVEEIVGDIFDEHDVAQQEIVVLGVGRARIDGGADPADLIEQFGLGEVAEADEYDTVAGYVIGKLGRIPEVGQTVRLGRARLEVVETTEQRVTSLELRVVGPVKDGEVPEEGAAPTPEA